MQCTKKDSQSNSWYVYPVWEIWATDIKNSELLCTCIYSKYDYSKSVVQLDSSEVLLNRVYKQHTCTVNANYTDSAVEEELHHVKFTRHWTNTRQQIHSQWTTNTPRIRRLLLLCWRSALGCQTLHCIECGGKHCCHSSCPALLPTNYCIY